MMRSRAPGYFLRRWRGEVPISTLLWRDMLVCGTAVNILATFVALMLAAQRVPVAWAAAVHFSPLPFNLFLFAAVLRAPARSTASVALAALWLAVMTLV